MAISTARLPAALQPGARRRDGLRRLLGPDYRMGFLFVAPIVVHTLALVT